jgi:hypothetical protein
MFTIYLFKNHFNITLPSALHYFIPSNFPIKILYALLIHPPELSAQPVITLILLFWRCLVNCINQEVPHYVIYNIFPNLQVFNYNCINWKTTQSRLYRNTQRSHMRNHKKWTIHTQNLRLKQSTTLQQQQQTYPVTPEDGQLGQNM